MTKETDVDQFNDMHLKTPAINTTAHSSLVMVL